jgi:hypothetical protein
MGTLQTISLALLCGAALSVRAQKQSVAVSLYDGIVIAGYVDQGAFVNFTGPNINYTIGHSKFIAGMLPSVRIKEDRGTTRNSWVTPNLGIGLTYCYKAFSIQLPLYYNTKTATENGRWHVGLGIGLRLNHFNKQQ